MTKANEAKVGWKRKLFLELTAYWLNVLYLTIFFAVFTSYRRLILADFNIGYSNWGVSFLKALVLAKVIMIGGLLPFGRRLENQPLMLPTLFQSALFTCWVALFTLVESTVRGLLHGKGLAGALEHLLSEGVHEFYAKCLVVFVAFIPFFAYKELGRVFGKGIIWELFFRKGPGVVAHLGDLDRLKYGQPNLPPAPGSLPQTVREQ